MSAAEDFIEEGRLLGLRDGRREGLVEGQRRLLLRQLRGRFGELPEAIVTRINAAEPDELEGYADRLLSARTPEEVVAL